MVNRGSLLPTTATMAMTKRFVTLSQPQWLEVTFKNVPMASERVEVTNRVCHSFGDTTFGGDDCDNSASYISGASLEVFDASSNPLWSNAFPECTSALLCDKLSPGQVFNFTESESKTAQCSVREVVFQLSSNLK